MQDLLEVDSVIKTFGTTQVLTDIYLRCVTGDIIGLLGRNGCGKTTLLKIIFGTLAGDYKFIRINGQVYQKPYTDRNLIQYLPQDGFLPGNLTVEKAAGLYYGRSRAQALLEDEILDPVRKTKVSHLSGGESRYLEIRMLLFSDAKFVMLDEPFNGVAPIVVDSIKEVIRQQSKRKGIILTDHDYRNVLDVANRYLLMVDGGLKKMNGRNDLVDWGYIPESGREKQMH
jgi:ABC-type multidrug transport system ATPase subunit